MKIKKRWMYWGVVLGAGIFMIRLSMNVWRLWKSGERIKVAEQELKKQEVENSELKKRLAEVQSPGFIEKEAREKLGLGNPGEEIVIVPPVTTAPPVTTVEEANWRKWWKLYISN